MRWRQPGQILQAGMTDSLMTGCKTQYTVFMIEQLREI